MQNEGPDSLHSGIGPTSSPGSVSASVQWEVMSTQEGRPEKTQKEPDPLAEPRQDLSKC